MIDEAEEAACRWVRPKKKQRFVLNQGDRILAFDVGQIHLAECVLEVDLTKRPPFHVVEWRINNLGAGTVTQSIETLCSMVKDEIKGAHRRELWTSVDHIVIEQQDRVNTKMVAMSHALQTALIMIRSKKTPIFASSQHKFGVFRSMKDLPPDLIKDEPKKGSSYARKKIRKRNSIDLTKAMLRAMGDETSISQLETTKADQQDDLADAFVYASGLIYKEEPFQKKPKK